MAPLRGVRLSNSGGQLYHLTSDSNPSTSRLFSGDFNPVHFEDKPKANSKPDAPAEVANPASAALVALVPVVVAAPLTATAGPAASIEGVPIHAVLCRRPSDTSCKESVQSLTASRPVQATRPTPVCLTFTGHRLTFSLSPLLVRFMSSCRSPLNLPTQ